MLCNYRYDLISSSLLLLLLLLYVKFDWLCFLHDATWVISTEAIVFLITLHVFFSDSLHYLFVGSFHNDVWMPFLSPLSVFVQPSQKLRFSIGTAAMHAAVLVHVDL